MARGLRIGTMWMLCLASCCQAAEQTCNAADPSCNNDETSLLQVKLDVAERRKSKGQTIITSPSVSTRDSDSKLSDFTNGTLIDSQEDIDAYGAAMWADQQFNSGGHRVAGNSVRLSNGFSGASAKALPSGHKVTYGDILALCGDYYGNADNVVSDAADPAEREARFTKYMWGCISVDTHDPLRMLSVSSDPERAVISLDVPSHCSSYVPLAMNNYDHFVAMNGYSFKKQNNGLGAQEAYNAGHSAACKAAAAGSGDSRSLELALMQNACASHFLSDMFAPGHMRNPRRALPGATYGLLAKQMHDEDNAWGLNIRNKHGDSWIAYGDHCHESPKNARNREVETAALSSSAEAVLQAWTSGSAATCLADAGTSNLIPDFARAQDPQSAKAQNNGAPMFVPVNNDGDVFGSGSMYETAYCRCDSCEMDQYCWNNWWSRASTLAKLKTTCALTGRGSQLFPGRCCRTASGR